MNCVELEHRRLPLAATARVLACGAWLKNSACLLDGNSVWHSPVHGDLGDPRSRLALVDSMERLERQSSGPIQAVAHDLHPDFFSTELALQLARRLGVPAIAVQHHHAHIALLQAEQGLLGSVTGLALDGVGLGSDDTAWGGELLQVDGACFKRLAHLPLLLLPGGDIAAREPWRMAAALLHRLGRTSEIAPRLDLAGRCCGTWDGAAVSSASRIGVVMQRGLNCPVTTSAGRWFDAVAGLLGVCMHQSEEAQAAMALERLASQWLAEHPAPVLDADLVAADLNLDGLMLRLIELCDRGAAHSGSLREVQGEGAALFHVALAAALARAAATAAQRAGIGAVALGGGCFFNQVLRDRVTAALTQAGLAVCLPQRMNFGDTGLALGQAWVAAQNLHADAAMVLDNSTRKSLCV